VQTLLAREPGDPTSDHRRVADLVPVRHEIGRRLRARDIKVVLLGPGT
jgi:hypothetical protein